MTHTRRRRIAPWRQVAAALVASWALACGGDADSDAPWTLEPDPEDGSWLVCRASVCEELGVEGPYDPRLVDPTTYPEVFQDLEAWFKENDVDVDALRRYVREFHPALLGLEPAAMPEPCEGPATRDEMLEALDVADMASAVNAAGTLRDAECR